MRFHLHVHHHVDPVVLDALHRIVHLERLIMSALDDLRAEVARNTAVEASAVTLIQGLAGQLQAALDANDTAALQDLTTQLASSADALAAAVTANTPAPAPAPAGPTPDESPPAPAPAEPPATPTP